MAFPGVWEIVFHAYSGDPRSSNRLCIVEQICMQGVALVKPDVVYCSRWNCADTIVDNAFIFRWNKQGRYSIQNSVPRKLCLLRRNDMVCCSSGHTTIDRYGLQGSMQVYHSHRDAAVLTCQVLISNKISSIFIPWQHHHNASRQLSEHLEPASILQLSWSCRHLIWLCRTSKLTHLQWSTLSG